MSWSRLEPGWFITTQSERTGPFSASLRHLFSCEVLMWLVPLTQVRELCRRHARACTSAMGRRVRIVYPRSAPINRVVHPTPHFLATGDDGTIKVSVLISCYLLGDKIQNATWVNGPSPTYSLVGSSQHADSSSYYESGCWERWLSWQRQ
jgi:hypothetical protein